MISAHNFLLGLRAHMELKPSGIKGLKASPRANREDRNCGAADRSPHPEFSSQYKSVIDHFLSPIFEGRALAVSRELAFLPSVRSREKKIFVNGSRFLQSQSFAAKGHSRDYFCARRGQDVFVGLRRCTKEVVKPRTLEIHFFSINLLQKYCFSRREKFV